LSPTLLKELFYYTNPPNLVPHADRNTNFIVSAKEYQNMLKLMTASL